MVFAFPGKSAPKQEGRNGAAHLALTSLPLHGSKHAVSRGDDQPPTPKYTPPTPIPNNPGIVVLLSGKQEDLEANWVQAGNHKAPQWRFEDGVVIPRGDSIVSKQEFTDFQLHVEFRIPFMPNAHGQERGNSGVGLQTMYEIQVLDSYGFKEPGAGDCGAVYNQSGPLFNACKPPLEWQTYDITFRAARWDANGNKIEKARVTVIQNGIIVQNNQEINHPTGIGGDKEFNKPAGIILQNHGNEVAFRNVWVLPLPTQGPTHYDPR